MSVPLILTSPGGGSTTPGGNNGDIQYNNNGVLGGETLVPLAHGGTNADLSATGGASQFLKQASAGAAITVVQPSFSDLSGSAALSQLPNPTTAGKGGFWGFYINTPSSTVSNSGNLSAQNAIRAWLFTLPYPTTISGLAIQVSGTAQAGTVLDVGLYDINGNGILNTNGSAFGGTGIDGTSIGVKSKTFTRVNIAAGQYYLAWTGKTTGTLASVAYQIASAANQNTFTGIAAGVNGFAFLDSDSATNGILPSSLTIAHLSASTGVDPPATWFGS